MSILVEPHLARRLIAASAVAIALLGLLLVLLVATLMGGLAPPSTCGPGAGTPYAPSRAALADIPGNYLQWIRQAGDRYELDWSVIAGIYSIETDFGRLDAPGVRSGENSAGAGGPGQFLEPTWRVFGVDGDGDGVKDRYNPADAIPGTANLLRRSGAPAAYRRAIFAYNHASWYVDDVLSRAGRYRGAAEADPDAVQPALVDDASATAACAELVGAGGPADLNRAIRLSFPAAYRGLPAWAMAAERPAQPVDARIYNDVLWLLRRYNVRVTAAREAGHHTHGDGTAVDLVPAVGATQRDWDDTVGRLARDLGWTESCGTSGARPACALKPAIQWIGYDGYSSHGSPRTCSGDCPAHIHVSWVSGCYGSSALVVPCAWVMAFPAPNDGDDGVDEETVANAGALATRDGASDGRGRV
ncbi:MAG: lytic transglycosylase domain-containing protein [Solirubrobacteraceae bacterium]